jgi:hypothetical protein
MTTKKRYTTPRLQKHGLVREITAAVSCDISGGTFGCIT